jgi:hypothetical protein
MASRDFTFLTLRNVTAYKPDNSVVPPNTVFVTGTNGSANFSDSIQISTINNSTINTSTINNSTINTNIINNNTINTSTIYNSTINTNIINNNTINTSTINNSTINTNIITSNISIISSLYVSSIAVSSSVTTSTIVVSTMTPRSIVDNNGSLGASGQILSAGTGSALQWINPPLAISGAQNVSINSGRNITVDNIDNSINLNSVINISSLTASTLNASTLNTSTLNTSTLNAKHNANISTLVVSTINGSQYVQGVKTVTSGSNTTITGTSSEPIVNLNSNITISSLTVSSITNNTLQINSTLTTSTLNAPNNANISTLVVSTINGSQYVQGVQTITAGSNTTLTGTSTNPVINMNNNIIASTLTVSSITNNTLQINSTLTASTLNAPNNTNISSLTVSTINGIPWVAPSNSLWSESGGNIYNMNSAGNVGIGLSDPQTRLDVSGTGRFTDNLTCNSTLTVSTINLNDGVSIQRNNTSGGDLYLNASTSANGVSANRIYMNNPTSISINANNNFPYTLSIYNSTNDTPPTDSSNATSFHMGTRKGSYIWYNTNNITGTGGGLVPQYLQLYSYFPNAHRILDIAPNGNISTFNNFRVGGNIMLAQGSAVAPSLTFSTDADTGLYGISDGQIGISANGSERMNITSNDITLTPRQSSIEGAAGAVIISGNNYNTYTKLLLQNTSTTNSAVVFNMNSGNGEYSLYANGSQGAPAGSGLIPSTFQIYSYFGGVTHNPFTMYPDGNTNIGTPNTTAINMRYGITTISSLSVSSINGTAYSGSGNTVSAGNNNITVTGTTNKVITLNSTISVSTLAVSSVTSKLILTQGSAGNPALTFLTDSDTGLYGISDGQMGISANAQEKIRITGNDNILYGNTTISTLITSTINGIPYPLVTLSGIIIFADSLNGICTAIRKYSNGSMNVISNTPLTPGTVCNVNTVNLLGLNSVDYILIGGGGGGGGSQLGTVNLVTGGYGGGGGGSGEYRDTTMSGSAGSAISTVKIIVGTGGNFGTGSTDATNGGNTIIQNESGSNYFSVIGGNFGTRGTQTSGSGIGGNGLFATPSAGNKMFRGGNGGEPVSTIFANGEPGQGNGFGSGGTFKEKIYFSGGGGGGGSIGFISCFSYTTIVSQGGSGGIGGGNGSGYGHMGLPGIYGGGGGGAGAVNQYGGAGGAGFACLYFHN